MNNELTSCRGGMLQQYYEALFHTADRERARRLAKVDSYAAAEEYKAEIREKIRRCFGKIPEVTIRSSQVTGILQTSKLTIEKLLLETQEGRFIPALFYYPTSCAKPFPGILLLCGHAAQGKAHTSYQEACQSLALRGFGVLCPEAFGQGERREFGGGPGNEHDILGLRSGLFGEFFGSWRLHDGLSALEYLKSRAEIDASKIGVTGCSGGGTLTSYVSAFSHIPCMTAPICSITEITRNLENEIYTDCEQTPPNFKKYGLEETDLFLVNAPRPCYLGIQDNDFFDPRGTEEIVEELKLFYQHFHEDDKVVIGRGVGEHGFTAFHRNHIGKFFSDLVQSQSIGDDTDIMIFPEEQLFCAPAGDVRNIPDSKSAQNVLNGFLQKNQSSGDMQALKEFLELPIPTVPGYRKGFQQYFEQSQLHACRFLLNTEPGIEVALKKIGRTLQNKLELDSEITLLLPEKTGITEFYAPEGNWLLEVRGVGETLSCSPDSDLMTIYPPLYNACGLMSGKSMFGGQVRDILACLLFLEANQVKKVNLLVKGSMIYAALTAAQWSPLPLSIEAEVKPSSWADFVRNPKIQLPYSCVPFGILQYADIPQLIASAQQAGHAIHYKK